ncbi:MAG: tRNA glutamyl-Q(34) synthetase GluQRS [Bryobacteraceae bacterium]
MGPRYRGRFAPSPTGPLHFGSLVAAVGSYLDAKSHGGEWLVRMEDLDKPREAPGAADAILRCLERMGFEWDGAVMYQSYRTDAYREALERLVRAGAAFACSCSRRDAGDVYPGTCRAGAKGEARSWRFRVGNEPVAFTDRVQGRFEQSLETGVGDFVLLRADGIFAYQLAVVVDDAEQGITDVVRGADLLDSTPRQIALAKSLGVATPEYLHLPLVLGPDGQKLSKQTLAPAVEESGESPGESVWQALEFLGQGPPVEMKGAGPRELLEWGVGAWDVGKIPVGARG